MGQYKMVVADTIVRRVRKFSRKDTLRLYRLEVGSSVKLPTNWQSNDFLENIIFRLKEIIKHTYFPIYLGPR